MHGWHFSYSSVGGQVVWFHFLAIVHSAATKKEVQLSLWGIQSAWGAHSGVVQPGNVALRFLGFFSRSMHTDFHVAEPVSIPTHREVVLFLHILSFVTISFLDDRMGMGGIWEVCCGNSQFSSFSDRISPFPSSRGSWPLALQMGTFWLCSHVAHSRCVCVSISFSSEDTFLD